MNFKKPQQLIDLLNNLKIETDKTKYQNIYIDIFKEAMSIEFQHHSKEPFQGIIYKKLIEHTIKDYMYLGQTSETISNLDWLIEFLDSTLILVR